MHEQKKKIVLKIKNEEIHLFWGDKQHELSLQDIEQARYSRNLQQMFQNFCLESMIVLDQQHGAFGYCVDQAFFLHDKINLYQHVGDYLLTDLKRCGLVVLTADCLPIVLYDHKKSVVGIVHSGWKGSVQKIVISALQDMQRQYKSNSADIQFFLGASAQSCCYEVQNDFYEQFLWHPYAKKSFFKRDNKLYFDNKRFVIDQLLDFGIQYEMIYDKQPNCTICCDQYSSFRREKDRAGRQMTIVALL